MFFTERENRQFKLFAPKIKYWIIQHWQNKETNANTCIQTTWIVLHSRQTYNINMFLNSQAQWTF